MKKNVMMRIASVLMIAVLLTTCVISGTFAKYTSSATGSDSVQVAQWSFTVDGEDIAETNTLVFDLFSTINDTVDSTDEDDVKDDRIAPGTEGTMTFALQNTSEVTAKYSVVFDATNASNIPIEYKLGNAGTWGTLAQLNTAAAGETDIAKEGGTATITVYWRWAYERTIEDVIQDAADTELGVEAPSITFTATFTATQKD